MTAAQSQAALGAGGSPGFAGIVFYGGRKNTGSMTLSSGANWTVTGTYYTPAAQLKLNGGPTSNGTSIIAGSASVAGSVTLSLSAIPQPGTYGTSGAALTE